MVSRLLPVLPFGFLSYGWGMVNVPARSYAIATLLGMTPPTLLLSYLGESFADQASGVLTGSTINLHHHAERPFPMVQSPSLPQVLYPDSDGQPMADNTLQYRWIVRLVSNLKRLLKDQTAFVAGDLL